MSVFAVVVIGAGHAGVQVAASLREEGYEGALTLLSAETHLPYQRPPLSKAYLKGAMEAEGLPLRAAQFYGEKNIDLRLGEQAARIDRGARCVELASGGVVDYGHLVLATGARARPLDIPGIDLQGVLGLRDLDDARSLRERLAAAERIVVIGAGFIGLEIAATAASLGRDVTVIEVSPRPLGRAVSPATSAFFLRAHEEFGAKFRLGVGVKALHGRAGAVDAVELSDGERLPADLAIVGIGVLPEDRLARAAGLACENGVIVDRHLETSDPHISAIGDCAIFPSHHLGFSVRLESVQNAVDQAKTIARRIVGKPEPYAALPVVLERPGRSETADRRALPWLRSMGGARRSTNAGFRGLRFSRFRACRGRDGQSPRRSHGRKADHRRRSADFARTGRRSRLRFEETGGARATLTRRETRIDATA